MDRSRQMAIAASPAPGRLYAAQRSLLRRASTNISRKGVSSMPETYRRLGILIPHWKYPADFESTLQALREYWMEYSDGCSPSLGRSRPFIRARQHAVKYIRALAQKDRDGDGDDGGDDGDLEDRLPSAATVRMFRLINGNLEIPPTILKALTVAGRIDDAFFPDEPATWRRLQGSSVGGESSPSTESGACATSSVDEAVDEGVDLDFDGMDEPRAAKNKQSPNSEKSHKSQGPSKLMQQFRQQLQEQLGQANNGGTAGPMTVVPMFIRMPSSSGSRSSRSGSSRSGSSRSGGNRSGSSRSGNSRSGDSRSGSSSGSSSRSGRAVKSYRSRVLRCQGEIMRRFLESEE